MTLLTKLGIGVLGLGTSSTVGYGIYEFARPKTISEILSRSWTVLKTSETDNPDDSHWTSLVNKHKEENREGKPDKLTFEPTLENDQIDNSKLKAKCATLLLERFNSEDDKNYKDASNWCTDKQLKDNQG